MPDIKLAQVGCGGMGLRHLYGQAESQRTYGTFDYVAVCDVSESAASHVAAEAERLLGKRPNVYTSFDDLLAGEPGLDAVDIVTAAGQHHTIAVRAAEAGVHVATEKPMGITVRACMRMMEAADEGGIVLSVSENYRRDPLNRLNKAILDAQVLGRQRLFLDMAARGTRLMPHGTAWRHIKTGGGYMLDYAVHNADLLLYFMGPVDRVYAETHLWEETRLVTDPEGDQMRPFYAHREPLEIERAGEVECTSEDMASGVVRFESGAMANFLSTIAAPGEGTGANIIYCDDGSIRLRRKPLRAPVGDHPNRQRRAHPRGRSAGPGAGLRAGRHDGPDLRRQAPYVLIRHRLPGDRRKDHCAGVGGLRGGRYAPVASPR